MQSFEVSLSYYIDSIKRVIPSFNKIIRHIKELKQEVI
jgi:hypothetical protein